MLGLVMVLAAGASQISGGAKLFILRGNDGIAITEYSSLTRCEAARASIADIVSKDKAASPMRTFPNGGVIIPDQIVLRTFCISS